MSDSRRGRRVGPAARHVRGRSVAAVLAGLALVAACGDQPPAPEGEPLAADERTELAERIATAMAKAQSSRVDVTMDVTAEQEGESIEITSVAEGVGETTDTPAIQLDLSVDMTGSVTESIGPIELRSDGEQFLVRGADPTDIAAFAGTSEYGADPNEWVEVGSTAASKLSSSATTYTEYAELIDTVDAADGGQDETGHRYNLVLTMQDAKDAGIELSSVDVEALYSMSEEDRQELLDTPIMVSMWLDDEDRIVQQKIETSMDVAGVTMDLTATVELADFGTPVPTDLPQV